MLEGQVHGGVVQGIGQALLEHAVYDPDSGQLLSGSFMDYAMPRAGDLPSFDFSTHNVPSTSNPFGVKGAGEAGAVGAPPAETFPNGCHIVEVEIDPATGAVGIARYTIVDDFGRTINPMMLEGQVHGGVVQGIGQALFEHAVYDPESGQLLSGSFMDYAMPRAGDIPLFDFSTHNVPSTSNPFGVKGAGEAGAVGAPPAVINAIVDALHHKNGARHIDMPATPRRVWEAINGR
jgi:carbon-monoxide dehydrogenase large subunit